MSKKNRFINLTSTILYSCAEDLRNIFYIIIFFFCKCVILDFELTACVYVVYSVYFTGLQDAEISTKSRSIYRDVLILRENTCL